MIMPYDLEAIEISSPHLRIYCRGLSPLILEIIN